MRNQYKCQVRADQFKPCRHLGKRQYNLRIYTQKMKALKRMITPATVTKAEQQSYTKHRATPYLQFSQKYSVGHEFDAALLPNLAIMADLEPHFLT